MKRFLVLGLRLLTVGPVLAGGLCLAQASSAGEAHFVFDPEYAEEINGTCAGCHGENGAGTADGVYPRLAGQSADYLAKQLRAFKARTRINIPMLPYTTERELPDEDVLQITTYLSRIDLPTKLASIAPSKGFNALDRLREADKVLNIPRYPGDIAAGERLYAHECRSCHGTDGRRAKSRGIPLLAGQHSLYLKRQIVYFRKGTRVHDDDPEDAKLFQSISDADLENLLAYLSVLDDR